MSKIVKKVKKIIPKEVRPALPALAAVFGPAALFGTGGVFAGTALASAPVGIQAALINAATQAATEGKIDPKQAALSGITAQLGASAKAKFPGTTAGSGADPYDIFAKESIYSQPATSALSTIPDKVFSDATIAKATAGAKPSLLETIGTKVGQTLSPVDYSSGDGILSTIAAGAKASAPTATYAYGKEIAELNEKALRDYEAQLREQGIMDSAERRNAIFGYFSRAGYGDTEINSMLDKYGYASGGRVGFKEGGGIQALIDYLKEKEDEDEEFNLGKFSTGLEGIKSGYEIATGQPLMGMKPQPTRFGLAEGGIPNVMAMRKTIAELIASGVIDEEDVEEAVAQIKNQAMMSMKSPGMAEGGLMNLKAGGMPAEMDMRGGGFIPIGAKERADDVPARLSKNEFVMTADAVRAAGGGNINKGAKRMYDLMNKLEAKA